MTRLFRIPSFLFLFTTCLLVTGVPTVQAQYLGVPQEHKPYDAKLLRLCEILGAIHYLRELCGADEGQTWRKQMKSLIDVEGSTAKRRARLVKSFNHGYRGYRRTYRSCTKPAVLSINRFMNEGATLAKKIIQENK